MPALRPEHVTLRWYPDLGRTPNVRVQASTCHCKRTVYELCIAGGLTFIRRWERGEEQDQVAETERLRDALTQETWDLILTGRAV